MLNEKVKCIHSFGVILLFLIFSLSCVSHREFLSEPEQSHSKENLKKLSRFPKLKLDYSCNFWVRKDFIDPPQILGQAVCEDQPNLKKIHPFHDQVIHTLTSKGFTLSENIKTTGGSAFVQKIDIRTEIMHESPISDLIHRATFGLYPAVDTYRLIMYYKIINTKESIQFEYETIRTVHVYWSSFFYLSDLFLSKPDFEFKKIINSLTEDSIQKAIKSGVYDRL